MTREEVSIVLESLSYDLWAELSDRQRDALDMAIEALKEQRPHGEWIRNIDDLYPEESTEECSVCHEEQRITGNDDNFCPNCGADMRKEGEAE